MQDTSRRAHRVASLVLSSLLFLAACATPSPKSAPTRTGPAPETKVIEEERWTDKFVREQVLTASEISLEGPRGLLAHLFTTQDAEHHTQTTKATTEGLRVETLVKDGDDYLPIRAKLDGWTLVADRRLVVLENPFAKAVLLHARGDVFLSADDSGHEVRTNDLRVVGELRR